MPFPLRSIALALIGLVAAVPAGAQVSAAATPADSVEGVLRVLQLSEGDISLNGRFVRGDHLVEAGDTVRGPLVVVRGNADIRGAVLGNVTAIFGDVTVHDGAEVRGSATAWRGRVLVEGGRVRGAIGARPVAAAERVDPPLTTGQALRLGGGWTAMLLIIGFLALVLASRNLDATARVLSVDYSRAFLAGVAGQLGFLPLLLLVVAALAVTLLGILLIPFALVAAPVAFAGLVTLGWLSMALVIGRAALRSGARDDRAAAVRALALGVLVLMAPWLIAAAAQDTGTVAIVMRAVAIGVSWVAATVGLGAAILSRAGTSSGAKRQVTAAPSTGWQTPTPVAGIATARRPVPARPEATK
jgi:hypothetical protein